MTLIKSPVLNMHNG